MSNGASETDDGSGCLMLVGIIIVGVAAGHLYSAAYGWLTTGILLILWAASPARKS